MQRVAGEDGINLEWIKGLKEHIFQYFDVDQHCLI